MSQDKNNNSLFGQRINKFEQLKISVSNYPLKPKPCRKEIKENRMLESMSEEVIIINNQSVTFYIKNFEMWLYGFFISRFLRMNHVFKKLHDDIVIQIVARSLINKKKLIFVNYEGL